MCFVTCICTLTARNDIFQRVFVVPQRTFLPARAHVRSAPPHLKSVHFLKNRTRSARPCATRTRSASTRSSLKKSSSVRPSPHGPVRPVGQNPWTAHLCFGNSSLIIKELWRQFSSYQRTVQTVQLFSKNCPDSSVLMGTVLNIGTDLNYPGPNHEDKLFSSLLLLSIYLSTNSLDKVFVSGHWTWAFCPFILVA